MKYQICKNYQFVISGIEAINEQDAQDKAEKLKPKDFDFYLEQNEMEITDSLPTDAMKFENIQKFQDYIRINGTPDYIIIHNIFYTMDNFDLTGQEIIYGNIKHQKSIMVSTKDRYKTFQDAIVKEIIFFQRLYFEYYE